MGDSSIEWTDATWNPVTGCTKVSAGCKNCYSETVANRFWGTRQFTDVQMHSDRLEHPLYWRKPRRIFVNSMSDLFHEDVRDTFIADVFGVMARAPQHTFQILTKRADRMLSWMQTGAGWMTAALNFQDRELGGFAYPWPLPNVWLGVSCEDQKTADERIPLLLQTPASIRFVSAEPLLGPVDFASLNIKEAVLATLPPEMQFSWRTNPNYPERIPLNALTGWNPGGDDIPHLDWVIIGGESGPGARPFDLQWAREIIGQCKATVVPVFMKQAGSRPYEDAAFDDISYVRLKDRKGGSMEEWPEDLRVREYPA